MKNTLKTQVENILKEHPDTRNSDITLMIKLWLNYYADKIKGTSPNVGVLLRDLYELPREDNIKRIRAKFNAEGKYYPTDPKVAKQRGIKEDEWREFFGYPIREETVHPSKTSSYTEKFDTINETQKKLF